MSTPNQPTPDKVMQLMTGGWAAAILGSAAKHGVFDALAGEGDARPRRPANRALRRSAKAPWMPLWAT